MCIHPTLGWQICVSRSPRWSVLTLGLRTSPGGPHPWLPCPPCPLRLFNWRPALRLCPAPPWFTCPCPAPCPYPCPTGVPQCLRLRFSRRRRGWSSPHPADDDPHPHPHPHHSDLDASLEQAPGPLDHLVEPEMEPLNPLEKLLEDHNKGGDEEEGKERYSNSLFLADIWPFTKITGFV